MTKNITRKSQGRRNIFIVLHIFIEEKIQCISGSTQFKPMFFKGQLTYNVYIHVYIYYKFYSCKRCIIQFTNNNEIYILFFVNST